MLTNLFYYFPFYYPKEVYYVYGCPEKELYSFNLKTLKLSLLKVFQL